MSLLDALWSVPGWGWVLIVVALLHVRSLPLSYTLLAGYHIVTSKRDVDPFEGVTFHRTAWPDDCDYNLHMNNSAYNKIADTGRVKFFVGTHMYMTARKHGWTINNGGVGMIFLREIKPFGKYEVRTYLKSVDSKWIGLAVDFTNGDTVHARGLCTIKIKARDRRTVAPAELLRRMGVDEARIESATVDEVRFPSRSDEAASTRKSK